MPALAVFAKAPLPGHAKTRLGKQLGAVDAAQAYETLLELFRQQVLLPLPDWDICVFVAREMDRPWFEGHWPEARLMTQYGENLGDRISTAFEAMFLAGHNHAIVVGTDIPNLTAQRIVRADQELKRASVSIGPTEDGGYYLLGQRSPGADLFRDVAWNSSSVYRQTLELALAEGLSVNRLEPLYDVDTLSDWQRFQIDRSLRKSWLSGKEAGEG